MTKRKRKGRKVKLRPRFFIVLLVLVVIVGFGGYKAYNHMIAERMAAQQAKTQYEQGVKISLAAKAYINLGLKYSDQYYKGGYPPTHAVDYGQGIKVTSMYYGGTPYRATRIVK